MAAPEGYTELARIGFADQGNYAAGATYRKGDVVYYNGSTWAALKDNLKGVTPANGANWKYMARGFAAEKLEDVKAKDTSGVLGTTGAEVASQALIDAIADRVMTKLVERSSIVQTESTDPSTVPSSPYFKQVTDKLTSDLTQEILKTPKKDQENLFSQMQNIEGAHFSLDTPQLSLTARVDQNQYSRPTLRFNCYGIAAAELYLDTDGSLKYRLGNSIKTVNMT